MEGPGSAALDNLKRGLSAVGANFADIANFANIVTADRFVTDVSDQISLMPTRHHNRTGRAPCHRSALPCRDQFDRGYRLKLQPSCMVMSAARREA
jgi:hypothetical protein